MTDEPCGKCGKQFIEGHRIGLSENPEPHTWLCEKCYNKWLYAFNTYKGRRVMGAIDWDDCWNTFMSNKKYIAPEKVVFT